MTYPALVWGNVLPPRGVGLVSDATLVSSTSTSITLTWTADRPVQSWVEYGPTTAYGSESAHETSFRYSTHIQTIGGLTPGTEYHFLVHIADETGGEAIGNDIAFSTSGGVTPPPPPPTGMTYTDYAVPAGVTTIAGLQSFVNGVPNGASTTQHSRILLGAGRTYTGTAGLVFSNRQHLTFEGGGTEVAYGHTGGAIVESTGAWGSTSSSCFYHGTGANDIVFHALTALGSSPSSGGGAYASSSAGTGTDGSTPQEYAMGFALYGARNITIDHCIMDRNKGDGVYVAASGGTWTTNLILRDSTIKRNGRMGLGIIAADGITGQRVFFDDICYSPIDYEPNGSGEGARGVHLWEDCLFGDYSWDNHFGEGTIIFITGSSAATFTGSLTARRLTIEGRNMAFPSRSGSLFYLHRGAAKAWTLLLEGCDGSAAEGPAPYVVVMGGWSGATTIRDNHNMVTGSPTSGMWVYDAGGNTGAKDWQTSD